MFALDDRFSLVTTEYGIVMLNMKKGNYWELNRSGALVLEVLVQGGDVARAAQRLTDEYGIDVENAERDAADVVSDLVAAGILRELTP